MEKKTTRGRSKATTKGNKTYGEAGDKRMVVPNSGSCAQSMVGINYFRL